MTHKGHQYSAFHLKWVSCYFPGLQKEPSQSMLSFFHFSFVKLCMKILGLCNKVFFVCLFKFHAAHTCLQLPLRDKLRVFLIELNCMLTIDKMFRLNLDNGQK